MIKINLNIPLKNRKGISLGELLVAMVLIGLLMSATFYVFSSFFAASMSNERQAHAQSDVQVGAEIVKWDVFMSGYGCPASVIPIQSFDNAGEENSDILCMQSVAFGLSGNPGKWSYMLSPVQGLNQIVIRRWNDVAEDITVSERIVIISPTKGQVGMPFYNVTDTTRATGPAGQDAWILTLDNTIQSSLNFVYVIGSGSTHDTTIYGISNGNLMRDNMVFMPGVINMQISYWIDIDSDKRLDFGETFNNLTIVELEPRLLDNVMLMRMSLVTATRGEESYIFAFDTLQVENTTIYIDSLGRNFKYDLWENAINPRNL